jgi:hypothetical protein
LIEDTRLVHEASGTDGDDWPQQGQGYVKRNTTRGSEKAQPLVYQIRIKGHLGREWTDWFGCLTLTLEDNGDTLLTGPVVDQAALHGLLRKVRDLGVPLLSVNRVKPSEVEASEVNETHHTRSNKRRHT